MTGIDKAVNPLTRDNDTLLNNDIERGLTIAQEYVALLAQVEAARRRARRLKFELAGVAAGFLVAFALGCWMFGQAR